MTIHKIFFYLCLIIGIFCANLVKAQTIKPQNLSNIRVDELSDAQIRRFVAQVGASGLTDPQLEQRALSSGMKPEEIQKLKERVKKLQKGDQSSRLKNGSDSKAFNTSGDSLNTASGSDTLSVADKALAELKSKIFGADLFTAPSSTFEPNIRIATPLNYQVGPDDELIIDIYGFSEASYKLKVSPEGTINVPYVGLITVGGMTIEQATSRIRTKLSSIYSGIKTGNTKASVSLGSIRSIKVILTGELVKPGTYTLPSVGSVFNALYQSGGPSENGSFREIEVIRAGVKIATMDVYDFLLRGEFKNNIQLKDQDVIRVPTYNKRVEIVGEVKRPGIFEMVNGESLNELLRFSGNFTERAYQARIKVLKNTATERKISDIKNEAFATYQPTTGDKFFIDEILDRFENRVTIEGAIFRPGQYELEKGLMLSQLIRKAEGLREDAFLNRGYILRLKNNLQTELISFDFSAILLGNIADIPLQREDVISISSIFDLKEEYYIKVEGEVSQPGKIDYSEGMTLEDAILQSGGLKESATTKRVEVSRRVKNSNVLSISAQNAEVFQVDINQDLKSTNFVLQPFDIVVVRSSVGYEVQKQVKIEGEVLYPGIYSIISKDERISDLIKRAGGFTAQAYIEGASLKRSGVFRDNNLQDPGEANTYALKTQSDAESAVTSDGITKSLSDTSSLNLENDFSNKNEFVGISLPEIISVPKSKFDIFLEEGDILYIPKQLQTVKVSGQVLSPSTVVYSRGKGFKSYITSSGGFNQFARKKRAYIKYANGSIKGTKRFLVFNYYPSVDPGAEIVVPKGSPKRPFNISEIVGVTTSIMTLLLLFNQFK